MSLVNWLAKRLVTKLRNRTRQTWAGQLLRMTRGASKLESLCIVSATRLTEVEFWKSSALGNSLKPWLGRPHLSINIRFENKAGLAKVYNPHLGASESADIVVFVHDDVWLDDPEWISKIRVALARFDVVGVAGNRRISPRQPAWAFSKLENGQFIWDYPYLSGAVGHGELPNGAVSDYGYAPARCELLDGVFLAVNRGILQRSDVVFDSRFNFHFYDMDFCRSARQAGLSLGTWPIILTHQSGGAFGTQSWQDGYAVYLEKWN